jgi:hypothetical protein
VDDFTRHPQNGGRHAVGVIGAGKSALIGFLHVKSENGTLKRSIVKVSPI